MLHHQSILIQYKDPCHNVSLPQE
ncbi:hypothetical protein PUN4_430054 [Paraburkholderia unamae]|nr:hypothetical protein PUN4_430054 [Paraburkholderia unamae]